MRPIRNHIYCHGCRKPKMFFAEQNNADNFIKFNAEDILEETGKAPVRSYYCYFCCGWHVTSNPSTEKAERIDKIEQRKINELFDAKKSKEEIEKINATISDKLLTVESSLIHGDYDTCEMVIAECQAAVDGVKSNYSINEKRVRAQQKIDSAKSKMQMYKQISAMSHKEQDDFLKACKENERTDVRRIIKNCRATAAVNAFVANKELLIRTNENSTVNEIANICRELVNCISGHNSKKIKTELLLTIDRIIRERRGC